MKPYHLIVIGAGASGMMAAGWVAATGKKVLVVEKNSKPGRKIAITGKGRCNLTNLNQIEDFLKHVYCNHEFIRPAIENFNQEQLISFFNQNGLKTVTERGKRVYPATGKAFDVVDCLLKWCRKNGTEFMMSCKAIDIITENGHVKGITVEKDHQKIELFAKNVVVATGGKSYPATGSTGDGYLLAKKTGHLISEPFQSLVPLQPLKKLPTELHKLILKNIEAKLICANEIIDKQFGEMNFMDGYLSGPVILTLSRKANELLLKHKKVAVALDLKPALSNQKLYNRIQREIQSASQLTVKQLLSKLLPVNLILFFAGECHLRIDQKVENMTKKNMDDLVFGLKNIQFDILQVRPWEEAIMTAGGVDINQIDRQTLESKLVKGLYFTGEVMDIDATTGGYNLQIAFSTGKLAADAINTKQ